MKYSISAPLLLGLSSVISRLYITSTVGAGINSAGRAKSNLRENEKYIIPMSEDPHVNLGNKGSQATAIPAENVFHKSSC